MNGEPNMPGTANALGWWCISGEALVALLRRAAAGEDPDLLYAEAYANSRIERPGEYDERPGYGGGDR